MSVDLQSYKLQLKLLNQVQSYQFLFAKANVSLLQLTLYNKQSTQKIDFQNCMISQSDFVRRLEADMYINLLSSVMKIIS